MPFTIFGIDTEFAVATGSNVGTTANSSTFDNPPQGSMDLRITTIDGDESPRDFDPGDTYQVTWAGSGGGGTILNAVVIRSDPAPDGNGGGIIVFEGLDQNGQVAQVIWTPGFDLEGWYTENYNPSNEPQFFTQDMDPEYSHRFVCFAFETRIKTPDGMKPVGSLQRGDLVMTKDAGPAEIRWIGSRICPAIGPNAPVVFDRDSISNRNTLRLSQQHRIMWRSPLAQYYFGSHEVLVPAKAFANNRTIRIVPGARICYVHLLLDQHHLLQAEGTPCESLFLGDQATKALYGTPDFDSLFEGPEEMIVHKETARPVLSVKEARLLLRSDIGCMVEVPQQRYI